MLLNSILDAAAAKKQQGEVHRHSRKTRMNTAEGEAGRKGD
jgi:hypothetical protein